MKKDIIKISISAVLLIIGLIVKFENGLVNTGIFILSYIVIGAEIIIEAIKNIFKGELFDENFLMSLATIGAIAIGEYPEAIAVMLFYEMGELFQERAVNKSRKSIESLASIRADYANLKIENNIKKVNPSEVKIGDLIVIKPGEKIPLDGIIIDGRTSINTSALTGESIPVDVEIGNEVLAGCININGAITVKVTKEFGESTVSKILNLIENADSEKAKSEKFITKFAKLYTPIVVVLALIIAIVPPLIIKGEQLTDWLNRAFTFLVISCPCALVISIPLGFFGGIGGASKKGILIKGSNYIEKLAKVKTVVFDKTGTLTKGVFDVTKVAAVNVSEEELLKLAAYSESKSNHPIAKSILKAYNGEIKSELIKNIEELSGYGIIAQINEDEILVGNSKLMDNVNIKIDKTAEIGTTVYLAMNKKYIGYIVISDTIKNDSKKGISELKKAGIKHTVMLTGDKESVASNIAKELKLDDFYAELLPNEKVKKIKQLKTDANKKEIMAFVGDGINDAPVLVNSDLGIAMGAIGSDAAIEAADIVIMNDEIIKIADAIKIAKKTIKIVKQNIIFAIAVKILVLLLGALGLANMWEAVFADVGVSIIAIINSLRTIKE